MTEAQADSRAKTLLTAMLLSLPAPLVTGLAVLASNSTTQLADFIRRTVELAALCISWWVFRRLRRGSGGDEPSRARLERFAGLSVGGAMICSGLVMMIFASTRLTMFEPSGNVLLGLTIASLGVLVNSLFWRRYASQTSEHYSSVIASQRDLYRAKVVVDVCVVAALSAVAIAPSHPATPFVDVAGSVIVAGYLFWSGFRAVRLHSARVTNGRLPTA